MMTYFYIFCHARYVGRLFVKSSTKPIEILEKLNKMAGFAPDQEIELFEVCSQYVLIFLSSNFVVPIGLIHL